MTVVTALSRQAGRWTHVAAAVVLVGLIALAAYAMFSGPTQVTVPGHGSAQPVKAPIHREEGGERGGGD